MKLKQKSKNDERENCKEEMKPLLKADQVDEVEVDKDDMGTLALNTVKFEDRRRNSSLVQKKTKEDLKVKTSLRKIQQKTPLKIKRLRSRRTL